MSGSDEWRYNRIIKSRKYYFDVRAGGDVSYGHKYLGLIMVYFMKMIIN